MDTVAQRPGMAHSLAVMVLVAWAEMHGLRVVIRPAVQGGTVVGALVAIYEKRAGTGY